MCVSSKNTMNFVQPSPTRSVLTCLLRSSVIRWIWIFFLPMFPLLQWEGQKRGRGHVRRRSKKDFSPLWNVWVTVVCPPRARRAGSQSHGGRRRRRGRTGLGERHLPQIMVPSVGVRSSTIQAQLGSCVLPFTSAQQLLKTQEGDVHVYLFALTHFSYYKHFICLRPGYTSMQSGISGAIQSHAET